MKTDSNMLKKGLASSELWIIGLVIIQQYFANKGIDIPDIPDITAAQEQVVALAEKLHDKYGVQNTTSVYLAGIYAVGRVVLKWRAMSVSSTTTEETK